MYWSQVRVLAGPPRVMIKIKNQYFLKLIYILILFIFAVTINQYYGFIGVFPIDTFLFYDTGYRVLNGLFPFKDYWSPTSPLIDFIQAGFFKLFGISWFSYVLHASIFNFILVFSTFYTLEKLKLNIHLCLYYSLLLGVIAYPVSGVPFNDHHSSILSIIGIFCFILSINTKLNIYWFLTPIFIGFAFICKQTPAGYVGIVIFISSIIYLIFNFNLKNILFLFLGSLLTIIISFLLMYINQISFLNFYEQYILFPMSLGDIRIQNFLFPLEFKRIFLRFKLIHLSQLVLIIVVIKSILKDLNFIKKEDFSVLISLILTSFAFIVHQLLTLNQIFIFFLIPVLLGFSHIYLLKNLEPKKIYTYLLIFLGLISTIYYKISYVDNRKFMELENINLKKSIDASIINKKFSGLNWVTIFYPNNPEKEIFEIKNSINIINNDKRNKLVATQYQFIASLMDEIVYSVSRTYTPGVSHPSKDSKFFTKYKNFFLEQIKKNEIKVIYTIKPYDSYIYDSIIPETCVKVEYLNEILKKHTLLECEELS